MVSEYGRNLRLEMPHGDWTGGGGGSSGGTPTEYYLLLSLGVFADANSTTGAALLRSLGKLEQMHAGRVLLHYPMPGTEDKYRANLLKKVQSALAGQLESRSAFMVVSSKPFADFHGDIHSFAVIDFDDYFNDSGTLNEKQLSTDLQVFSDVIRANTNIIRYVHDAAKQKPSWIDAFELKPGVFGIRFDLRKYAQLRKSK